MPNIFKEVLSLIFFYLFPSTFYSFSLYQEKKKRKSIGIFSRAPDFKPFGKDFLIKLIFNNSNRKYMHKKYITAVSGKLHAM